MRQALSLLLAILLSLPMLLVPQAETKAGKLPACCRRDGKHRCAMSSSEAGRTGGISIAAVNPKCEQYPVQQSVPPAVGAYLTPELIASAPVSTFAVLAEQVAAQGRVSSYRSRLKRGPPSEIS